MCIGAPAVVVEVDYDTMTALVDYGDGIPKKVLLGISEDRVKKGDLVVVHAGVIVSKIGVEELLEQVEFFKEVLGTEAESLISLYLALVGKSRGTGEARESG